MRPVSSANRTTTKQAHESGRDYTLPLNLCQRWDFDIKAKLASGTFGDGHMEDGNDFRIIGKNHCKMGNVGVLQGGEQRVA